MKFTKLLCLVLALLMLAAAFGACGEEAKETEAESGAPVVTEPKEEEDPRKAIKDGVPADLKYNDETVTFLVRTGYEYELCCDELENDILRDAIHYRNIDVENRLGIKTVVVAQDGSYSAYPQFNATLSTSVLNNTGDFDGSATYISQGSPLAKEGIYLNFLNIDETYGNGYLDLSKPWWNQALTEEMTVFDYLPFIAGDIVNSTISTAGCIFFNKEMFDEYFPNEGVASLYQTVKDQKWTIDKMIDYVDQVWVDTNSDGIPNEGDVLGYKGTAYQGNGGMDMWIYALGLRMTEKDAYGEPQISLPYNPNTIPAYEKMKKLYTGTNGSCNIADAGTNDTSMANGNQLFATVALSSGSAMRDSTINFGVLPYPKLDEEQEDYYATPNNICSVIVLCSNLSDERAKLLSAYLEVTAAESYKQVTPAYYGKVLQGIYSKDQPDAEMYDIIVNSFVIDFGFAYSNKSLKEIGSSFRKVDASFDIASHIESNKTAWESALEQLLAALEKVA